MSMRNLPRQRDKKDDLNDRKQEQIQDNMFPWSGPKCVNAFQIRIWARRKAIDDKQGHYALNVTGPILQFYEHYYNARYPLSKSGW